MVGGAWNEAGGGRGGRRSGPQPGRPCPAPHSPPPAPHLPWRPQHTPPSACHSPCAENSQGTRTAPGSHGKSARVRRSPSGPCSRPVPGPPAPPCARDPRPQSQVTGGGRTARTGLPCGAPERTSEGSALRPTRWEARSPSPGPREERLCPTHPPASGEGARTPQRARHPFAEWPRRNRASQLLFTFRTFLSNPRTPRGSRADARTPSRMPALGLPPPPVCLPADPVPAALPCLPAAGAAGAAGATRGSAPLRRRPPPRLLCFPHPCPHCLSIQAPVSFLSSLPLLRPRPRSMLGPGATQPVAGGRLPSAAPAFPWWESLVGNALGLGGQLGVCRSEQGGEAGTPWAERLAVETAALADWTEPVGSAQRAGDTARWHFGGEHPAGAKRQEATGSAGARRGPV